MTVLSGKNPHKDDWVCGIWETEAGILRSLHSTERSRPIWAWKENKINLHTIIQTHSGVVFNLNNEGCPHRCFIKTKLWGDETKRKKPDTARPILHCCIHMVSYSKKKKWQVREMGSILHAKVWGPESTQKLGGLQMLTNVKNKEKSCVTQRNSHPKWRQTGKVIFSTRRMDQDPRERWDESLLG